MIRKRLAVLALTAGLGLLSGCSGSGTYSYGRSNGSGGLFGGLFGGGCCHSGGMSSGVCADCLPGAETSGFYDGMAAGPVFGGHGDFSTAPGPVFGGPAEFSTGPVIDGVVPAVPTAPAIPHAPAVISPPMSAEPPLVPVPQQSAPTPYIPTLLRPGR